MVCTRNISLIYISDKCERVRRETKTLWIEIEVTQRAVERVSVCLSLQSVSEFVWVKERKDTKKKRDGDNVSGGGRGNTGEVCGRKCERGANRN